jgi:LacI family transcriptional regulator/LacI family purine nucleotide synthesis repressor/LacI family repressor for deo operon, udp, cdd, tsx, nupC, and nupG
MSDIRNERITIYRIATEAGVSAATVSRVLNGTQNVSDAKRKRIEEVIDRYDYRPSAIARSLTGQDTRVLGFIQPDIAHPYYNSLFVAAEQRALEQGYTFLLGNTLNDNIRHINNMETHYLRLMQDKHVDGVLIAGGRLLDENLSDDYMEEFRACMKTTPIVTVSGRLTWTECPSVTADEEAGMALIVNYLASLKHERIGFLGGYAGIEPTKTRLRSFQNSLDGHGLEYREAWHFASGFGIEEGRCAMESLLQVRDRPTAVVCFNDLTAIGAIAVAQRHGMRIPGDISIAGVDNIAFGNHMHPALTTVDLHGPNQAVAAANLLIDMIGDRHHPSRVPVTEHIQLEPTLRIRESCGRPS